MEDVCDHGNVLQQIIKEGTILLKKTVLKRPCTLSYPVATFRRDNI